jgi:D-alanyl-D-alanine carboxypeptidase/D-alanyl-D-alanine-endopeptidase (penicillin-binding protein 4)
MKKILVFFSLIFTSCLAYAALPMEVSEALTKAGIPESNVGIFVQRMDESKPSVSFNADVSMHPASVMKLVTTYAGLDILKPTYRWKTEIYSDGVLENGLLDGDVIIKGYGDPSFREPELRRMLVSLQQRGIKKIAGNLVLDKTYFAEKIGSTKRFDSDIWRSYNAKPSAVMVDGRKTTFVFRVEGEQVKIHQEVELPEVKIVNNMKFRNRSCGSWRSNLAYAVDVSNTRAVVTFSGAFSPRCGDKYLELSVFDDEKYAFFAFKKLWRQLGGTFKGRLRRQREMPPLAEKQVTQYSQALGSVVRDINKWSNNVMARQLLLTIAASQNEAPASEVRGMLAIKNWLAEKGQSHEGLVIENGSGLSRIERIKAENLGRLLLNAFQGPYMSELMSSMPILSLDGTLIRRLRGMPVSGRAHMKTGSINSVKAIAGYVLDAKSRRHVVVMMVNDVKASSSKKAQDALINWVYQQP